MTLKFDVWPCKTIGHLFHATSSFVHHFVAIGEFKLELQSRNAQFGSSSTIFSAAWPWNGWPRKIIGHLFYTTLSFVHHLKSISEFKLELQSGNPECRSKWTTFLSHVTLQFHIWPWKTIGHLFYATSSFVYHFVAIGEFTWELQSRNPQFGSNSTFLEPCDFEIWRMTLKNNRAPLLCYFKLCASFRSHWWILTGVTVRKPPIWVKFDDFLSRVTLKFDRCPWKTIGHLSYVTSIIQWWEHSEKGVTDGQMDRWIDGQADRRTENGKYHSLSCLVVAKIYTFGLCLVHTKPVCNTSLHVPTQFTELVKMGSFDQMFYIIRYQNVSKQFSVRRSRLYSVRSPFVSSSDRAKSPVHLVGTTFPNSPSPSAVRWNPFRPSCTSFPLGPIPF